MADDEIRTLERDLARTGDPDTCRRLARALDRAGRPREAFAALRLGCHDLGVRREAARAPRATGSIHATPRVRWIRALEGRALHARLVATPLAVVVGSARRTLLLDPDTGDTRAQSLPGELIDAGEVLLRMSSGGRATGVDLWTGEDLETFPVEAMQTSLDGDLLVAHHHVVLDETEGVPRWGTELMALRFEDLRRSPALLWRAPVSAGTQAMALAGDLVVASEAAYVDDRPRVALAGFDARTGALRFRVDDLELPQGKPVLDGRLVLAAPRGGGLAAVEPDGRVAWRLEGTYQARALTPTTVVALEGDPCHLAFLARATGEGPRVAHPALDARAHLTAFPDGVVLGHADRLEAFALDGRELWSWQPPSVVRGHVGRPEGLPGALYVLVGGRHLVCLELDTPGPAPSAV